MSGLGGFGGEFDPLPKNPIRNILTSFFVQWGDVDVSSIFIQIDSLSSW